MAQTRNTAAASLLTTSVLLLATSCGVLSASVGSGDLATTTFDFDDVTAIEVSNSFDVQVTIAEGPPQVAVTTDDNMVDELDVHVDGGTLRIGFGAGSRRGVTSTAVVTLPSLDEVDVSGASDLVIEGFVGESLSLDSSGASGITIEGSATSVDLDASGSSNIDLSQFDLVDATIDLSGASKADLSTTQQVAGEASGSSKVTVSSSASVSLDLSGASEIIDSDE